MWQVIVEQQKQKSVRRRLLVVGALAAVAAVVVVSRDVCLPMWWQGIDVPVCPEGRLRQVVRLEATELRRGAPGHVALSTAVFWASEHREGSLHLKPRTVALSVIDPQGTEHALPFTPADPEATSPRGRVTLPEGPDGDWTLRARVTTAAGESLAETSLALYSPARVHVITDRPLYEPGNVVKYRAVVLRARDLSPLDGRPGVWRVFDPQGEVVLEEKAPAGTWGVSSGSFPLDDGAPKGDWRIEWSSGGSVGTASIRVQPFTLPRFRVEAHPDKPFHRAGDKPLVKGRVVYSSGAPVSGAKLEIGWTLSGAWPAPLAWEESLLPKSGLTDANGAFELKLPEVPSDLRGHVTMSASIAATDPAGDRIVGGAGVLLSEDGIQASVVTELGGGLVGGSNNRVFVRVETPSGVPLPGATVRVRRAWDPRDPGVTANADADAVAALQIDPGPPVNIVVPPMPWRPLPPDPVVSRGEAWDMLLGELASLRDQKALDGWLPLLEPCARFVEGGETARLGLRVEASGVIATVGASQMPATKCVAEIARRQRLPAGPPRVLRVDFELGSSQRPSLTVEIEAIEEQPELLYELFTMAAADASACLPRDSAEGLLNVTLAWSASALSKTVDVSWLPSEGDVKLAAGALECLKAKFRGLLLPEPAYANAMGVGRLIVTPPVDVTGTRPQATTFLGYELEIAAFDENGDIGKTRLRLQPGEVPPLRLRANPVLAKAGESVTVELVRGPGFAGTLPKKLSLSNETKGLEADVDPEARAARFLLPADAEGWWSVAHEGAVARVFVQPKAALEVSLASDKAAYRPGATATLAVKTTAHGAPRIAAVGLFGVDESLGQLTTLRNADDLASIRAQVPMQRDVFPGLDAQALVMGRVRGENAAVAVVLGAGAPESLAGQDTAVSVAARTSFEPQTELADAFFAVLSELHGRTRAWEASAPRTELMLAPRMAALWREAVAAVEAKGGPAHDAYGRPLSLRDLPDDLLALVDPRAVVADGTRLPEDVESWNAFVAKERR